MRRAGVVGLVIAAGAAVAHAGPATAVTAEGGVEADSNVQRVETGPGLMTSRVAASVARLGAKLTRTGRVAGGGYALALGTLARTVIAGGADGLSPENVLLLSGDLRWLRPIGGRPVAAGVELVAVDAVPTSDAIGSRTFRTLAADGLLVLRGGDQRTLTFAAGGRSFTFKPDRTYDWSGPTGSVRLDLTLWQRAGGTRSVELSALFGFEARAYDSKARASKCPEDAPPSTDCLAPTSLQRNDRFQRAAIELTWTGRFLAAAAYQLSVTDSNSYGLSNVRHRATLSATTNLPWRLYGTALATLQIDQYPDGLLVKLERDLVTQTFTTLDDENRSSLQVRIARQVSKTWAVEGRGAIWRNLGGTLDTTFRRALLYVGAVYNR